MIIKKVFPGQDVVRQFNITSKLYIQV